MANYKNRGSAIVLDTHIATGAEADYTYTPANPLDMLTKYVDIFVRVNGEATGSFALEMTLNALSDFNEQTLLIISTTLAGADVDAKSEITLCPATLITAATSLFESHTRISGLVGTNDRLCYVTHSHSPTIGQFISQGATGGNSGNTITAIKIQTSTSTWKSGTEIIITGTLR